MTYNNPPDEHRHDYDVVRKLDHMPYDTGVVLLTDDSIAPRAPRPHGDSGTCSAAVAATLQHATLQLIGAPPSRLSVLRKLLESHGWSVQIYGAARLVDAFNAPVHTMPGKWGNELPARTGAHVSTANRYLDKMFTYA